MHIYFSGIGGAGIGPLALIAKQAGYDVSGSDQQNSQYIDYLKKHGITDIQIGQSDSAIDDLNKSKPIDWLVHSSSIKDDHPELVYARGREIKTSKRDELINKILTDKDLKLVAIAGTHGKTTTTAMVIWLLKQAGVPLSYSVGAKLSFGEMGQYQEGSEYFVYEADEFDRNFLAFKPAISLISGVSWDHHEIFPTREDYQQAFRDFIGQTAQTYIWSEDAQYLGIDLAATPSLTVLDSDESQIQEIKLPGKYNRLDGWLAIQVAQSITGRSVNDLINSLNGFPGLSRRMEKIIDGLYSDYAHTPEKIRGAMSVATEMAKQNDQDVVVVYEPLTDRRQHYIADDYQDCFDGAKKVYWIPSYLAREDPSQKVIEPSELIKHLSDPSIAMPAERDHTLKQTIQHHLDSGDMVVGIAGGGGGSLDDWLRQEFAS